MANVDGTTPKSRDWYPLREAEEEFATKFSSRNVASSIFFHSLAQGFIDSRYHALVKLPRIEPADDLELETHEGPRIPPFWWSHLLFDDPRTDIMVGRACFGNFWGSAEAAAEGIEVYRPNVVSLVSRKGVGGRPFEKLHWQRMTLHVVEIVRNGDLGRFDTFVDFKKDILEGIGDALSERAIEGPARQLWDQYHLSLKQQR